MPSNASNPCKSDEDDDRDDPGQGSVAKMDESDACLSGDRVLSPSGTVGKCQGIEITDGSDKFADQEGEEEGSCPRLEQPISSSEEKVWEEYGCILWDLSASRSHAELMVLKFPLPRTVGLFPHTHTYTKTHSLSYGHLSC